MLEGGAPHAGFHQHLPVWAAGIMLVCVYVLCCTLVRSMSGAPLTVIDSQLMVPQAEWDLLAQAADNRNIVTDLQGASTRAL